MSLAEMFNNYKFASNNVTGCLYEVSSLSFALAKTANLPVPWSLPRRGCTEKASWIYVDSSNTLFNAPEKNLKLKEGIIKAIVQNLFRNSFEKTASQFELNCVVVWRRKKRVESNAHIDGINPNNSRIMLTSAIQVHCLVNLKLCDPHGGAESQL